MGIKRLNVDLSLWTPAAGRSETWVCSSSLAGIAGSNSAVGNKFSLVECCVLSGRDLCDGPITRPEESHRVVRPVSVIAKPRDEWP